VLEGEREGGENTNKKDKNHKTKKKPQNKNKTNTKKTKTKTKQKNKTKKNKTLQQDHFGRSRVSVFTIQNNLLADHKSVSYNPEQLLSGCF
jgi:hypothetical protein